MLLPITQGQEGGQVLTIAVGACCLQAGVGHIQSLQHRHVAEGIGNCPAACQQAVVLRSMSILVYPIRLQEQSEAGLLQSCQDQQH